MLWISLRRIARRDNSIATLLRRSSAVFDHSSEGSSMFCHVGIPRSTIYALDKPAKNMMIAVRRIQIAICPFEMGNEEAESPKSPSPPCSGGITGGGELIL